MNLATIATTIKTHIAQTFLYDRDHTDLTNDTPLLAGGLVDSVRIVQLLSFLQKEFKVEVQLEDLTIKNFESIQAIARLVLRYRQSQLDLRS